MAGAIHGGHRTQTTRDRTFPFGLAAPAR